MSIRRQGVLFLETSDMSVESHLDGLLGYLRQSGISVTVASSDEGRLQDLGARNGVDVFTVRMQREPSPFADLLSLFRIFVLLSERKPEMVLYGTPKAALLGSLAAFAARVPRRTHVLHGLRVETLKGNYRRFFLALDRLIERLSTESVAVGAGLARKAVEVGSARRLPRVLGHGSAQGVDLEQFEPGTTPRPDYVISFIGRITADKGIDSLVRAFRGVRSALPAAELHIYGVLEGMSTLQLETQKLICDGYPGIRLLGPTADVPAALRSATLLCLPTRREGLPTVLLEAAAAGTPIVATEATGVRDIIDDRSGWIVPVDDVAALESALLSALRAPAERASRAEVARSQVVERFANTTVWEHWRLFIAGSPPDAEPQL